MIGQSRHRCCRPGDLSRDRGHSSRPPRLPQLTPNDPQYANQWALGATEGINAAPAGSHHRRPQLVIGILDTENLNHADLAGRWIAGYDFVADTNRSNDTDGRDTDALDPGDWVTAAEAASGPLAGCTETNSRWHGTLMAGVIGATGNNAAGIAV
jgi:serine protease